jgi:transposase
MLYAGVDVSKDKVSMAVLTSGGTKLTSGDFDITTEGLKLLELTLKHLKDEISMFIEQTGTYSIPVIFYLMKRVENLRIYLVDGLNFSRFIKLEGRKKQDKTDAVSLAEYGRRGLKARIITDKDIKAYELKVLISEREHLLKVKNQIENRLRQLIETIFPDSKTLSKQVFWSEVRKGWGLIDWKRLTDKPEVLSTTVRERKIWLEIIHSLEETEKEINTFLRLNYPEDVKILKSFGFSDTTTAYFISVYVDVERFKDVKAFKSYMGLGLRIYQSGKKEKNVVNSYTNKYIRKLLYMYVIQAIREKSNHRKVKDYYLRQVEKSGSKKKAIIKTAGKVIEWVYYCLKHREPFNWEVKHETQQKDLSQAYSGQAED